MENTTNITSKNIKKNFCEKCDFRCFEKGDFNRHLNSKKHNTTNTTKIQPKILHHCECGKKYAHRASRFSKIVSSGLVLVVSTTSQVTSYYPLYYISESFLKQKYESIIHYILN